MIIMKILAILLIYTLLVIAIKPKFFNENKDKKDKKDKEEYKLNVKSFLLSALVLAVLSLCALYIIRNKRESFLSFGRTGKNIKHYSIDGVRDIEI